MNWTDIENKLNDFLVKAKTPICFKKNVFLCVSETKSKKVVQKRVKKRVKKNDLLPPEKVESDLTFYGGKISL